MEIATWQSSGNSTHAIDFTTDSPANDVPSGKMTPFYYYPRTASPMNVTVGEVYNIIINFANGQSVSGFVVAQ